MTRSQSTIEGVGVNNGDSAKQCGLAVYSGVSETDSLRDDDGVIHHIERRKLVLRAPENDSATRDDLFNLLRSRIEIPDNVLSLTITLAVHRATTVIVEYVSEV